MTKEIVAAVIKEMPQEFHMDELFQRLVFIEEIEAARKEINNGNGIPRKEVIEKIEEAEKDVAEGRVIPNSDMQKLFEEWKK